MTTNRFGKWLVRFSGRRARVSVLPAVLTVILVSLVACGGVQTATQTPAGVAATPAPATAVTATPPPATAAATAAPAATAETPEVTAVATVSRRLTTVAPTAAVPTAAVATTAASGVVSGEGEVDLEDFSFRPQVLTVRVGTTVKFSNKDGAVHTVTSDTGLFESGSLNKGDDFFFTFSQVGEYPYYCAPHGGPGGQGMSGRIIVVP